MSEKPETWCAACGHPEPLHFFNAHTKDYRGRGCYEPTCPCVVYQPEAAGTVLTRANDIMEALRFHLDDCVDAKDPGTSVVRDALKYIAALRAEVERLRAATTSFYQREIDRERARADAAEAALKTEQAMNAGLMARVKNFPFTPFCGGCKAREGEKHKDDCRLVIAEARVAALEKALPRGRPRT